MSGNPPPASPDRLVAVTGATGFLGRHLLADLLQQGVRVRAVAYRGGPARLTEDLPDGVEVVWAGLDDADALTRAFTGGPGQQVDVIHAAGHISIRKELSPELTQTNIVGTQNVIAAARAAGVRRLLYVSSTHARREEPHGRVMAEDADFDPDRLVGGYNRSKAAASAAVLQAGDLSPVVVQPSGMLGPGTYGNGFLIDVLRQAGAGRRVVLVDGAYDVVDVRDVARSTVRALDRAPSGGVYLLTGRVATMRELVQLSAEVGGRPVRRPLRLPTGLMRRVAPLIEWDADRRGVEPVVTSFSIDTLRANSAFDNTRARRELGHDPRPVADTVRDTIAHWQDRP